MATNVLGINWYAHDASAALCRDGRITFAAAEERYSRVKKDNAFPQRAIHAALTSAGLRPADLDAVAFGWNAPLVTPLATLAMTLKGALPLRSEYVPRSLSGLLSEARRLNGGWQYRQRFGALPRGRAFYIDHHLAHAYSAWCLSGFEEAAVLVIDGRGARQATTLFHGQGGALRLRQEIPYPNSLGLFYEAFTDLLGFERHNDEWKVMGLAAYGEPRVNLDELLQVSRYGYRVNAGALSGRHPTDIAPLVARFGPRRDPEKLTDADRDLAASVQKYTEDAILAVVRDALRRVPTRNLCLAGGVAMNSKANGKVLASGLVDRIFIQPAATDDGTALGAALAQHHALTGVMPRSEMTDAYLGSEASPAEIEQTLRVFKIPFRQFPQVTRVAARLLADGKILGWFQGRMEFGPRALGNRSILADPRDAAMKDKVNECIKFREGWRPFAPSVLAERFGDYFEPNGASPFMILTHDVRPEKRAIIPAVTHVDHTARVQTVERSVNPRYWELISEFDALTGVPVVMNTSFNLRGEPIVCEPKDAVRTFFSSGMDFLVLGDFVVAKDATLLKGLDEVGQARAPRARGGLVQDQPQLLMASDR
jgi:carbamoyltransferase